MKRNANPRVKGRTRIDLNNVIALLIEIFFHFQNCFPGIDPTGTDERTFPAELAIFKCNFKLIIHTVS